MVFVVLIALDQIKIGGDIVRQSFLIILGGVVLRLRAGLRPRRQGLGGRAHRGLVAAKKKGKTDRSAPRRPGRDAGPALAGAPGANLPEPPASDTSTAHDQLPLSGPGSPTRWAPPGTARGQLRAVLASMPRASSSASSTTRGRRERQRIALRERTDDVWHCYLPRGAPRPGSTATACTARYKPEQGHRFNPHKLLLDPYARDLVGALRWSDALTATRSAAGAGPVLRPPRQRRLHAQVPGASSPRSPGATTGRRDAVAATW